MPWIILEGIDRSGKSTVAKLFEDSGYKMVHFKAPDKKYTEEGYTGPSYLDDLIEQLIEFDGQDVIFDRSWYGELIWPHVYGRKPQLVEEDFEVIKEFEDRNSPQRILMVDPDAIGHWKRCVDNNEPLNQNQFRLANTLYNGLAHKQGFMPRQLSDFDKLRKSNEQTKAETESPKQDGSNSQLNQQKQKVGNAKEAGAPVSANGAAGSKQTNPAPDAGLKKLEKANAISAVLSKRVVKQRGTAFDDVEADITGFLKRQLDELLGEKVASNNVAGLSNDEVQILKVFCQRLREKESQAVQTQPKRPQPVRR